jgi:hypothetical protein
MAVRDFNSTARSLASNSTSDDCIAVGISPGRGDIYSYLRNLNFTFKVSKFESRMTTVQLSFDTPADISTQPIHDLVAISIKNSRCFTGTNGI